LQHRSGPKSIPWHLKRVRLLKALRQTYSGLLMNGPFSVIVAHHGEMIGLTDRIKLRPMIAATKGDTLYLSSEEAAIRLVSPQLDKLWAAEVVNPSLVELVVKN
jgi:glutamate synthase domain-containing protein 1